MIDCGHGGMTVSTQRRMSKSPKKIAVEALEAAEASLPAELDYGRDVIERARCVG
jgi:hypothetical protein